MSYETSPKPPDLPSRRPASTSGVLAARPPLPPRPVGRATSRRKPVPAIGDITHSPATSSSSHSSGSGALTHLRNDRGPGSPPRAPSRTYHLTPAPLAQVDEKNEACVGYQSSPASLAGPEPRTISPYNKGRRRTRRLWLFGGGSLLVIIIIVSVVAALTTKSAERGSDRSASSDHGGAGHPLSIEDGGVDIEKPSRYCHVRLSFIRSLCATDEALHSCVPLRSHR